MRNCPPPLAADGHDLPGDGRRGRLRDAERDRVAGHAGRLPALGLGLRLYQRWNARGLPQHLVTRLRGRLREHQGRQPEPTACIIDSQIVKCADTVSRATSGYHGGKKITGRGRHLVVDTEGLAAGPAVTRASVSDKPAPGW